MERAGEKSKFSKFYHHYFDDKLDNQGGDHNSVVATGDMRSLIAQTLQKYFIHYMYG
jgi:hypothetical protein